MRARIEDRHRRARLVCALVLLLGSTAGSAATQRVVLQTSKGAIELELFPDKAPVTVANFLKYVDSGYYDGVVFHRVIADFMIQAGGYSADLKPRVPNAPIVNESNHDLHNIIGAVAMARLNTPNSATAQFFINIADNPELDFRTSRPGYAVFGRVSGGMSVVAAIAGVETGTAGDLDDLPIEPVTILSARRLK